jgi:FkbM family methyltransferase
MMKVLARSRSIGFTRNYLRRNDHNGDLATYRWRDINVLYRPGTSDIDLVYSILQKSGRKSEYCPPREFQQDPASIRVILDIGANVGVSSLYLAQMFPCAVVHAFEPAPANFKVLEQNSAAIGRIICHPYALGDQDGELALFASDNPVNFGGFSAYDAGVNSNASTRVPVRHVGQVLKEIGIPCVDLIKIDTEGGEWEILTAMDPKMLAKVRLIMGELHGRKDFALLDYLQPYFNIGLHKNIRSRLFNFYAVPRD